MSEPRRIDSVRSTLEQLRKQKEAFTALEVEKRRLSGARRYWSDPAAFLHDCFRWPEGKGPTNYQEEILAELPVRRRVSVRGPHGLGKSCVNAWAVLWFSLTRDGEDWKVITTASAWRQLDTYLWPEIHKWARLLRWDKLGREPFTDQELLQLNLKLSTGAASAVASNQPALIEGAHADHILYVFDESKAILGETFDAAEGAFSGAGADTECEALAIAASTPGEPQGRFYEIQSRKPGFEDWWVRHVTVEEAVAAGRISGEWLEQREKQWGLESAIYQNRCLGQFASSDEDSVIPLAWIEAAVARWEERNGAPDSDLTTVGVDVAREGADLTVLAPRYGNLIAELRRFRHNRTTETTGQVVGLLKGRGTAVVDVIGIGAGVVDELREQGKSVEPFNAGEKTDRTDSSGELGFVNKRSASWWAMRERLDPESGEDVCLPPDDLLIGDLSAPKWKVTSAGKIQVESKDEIRKRLGRSTDSGDAVIMAFWLEGGAAVAPPIEGSDKARRPRTAGIIRRRF